MSFAVGSMLGEEIRWVVDLPWKEQTSQMISLCMYRCKRAGAG